MRIILAAAVGLVVLVSGVALALPAKDAVSAPEAGAVLPKANGVAKEPPAKDSATDGVVKDGTAKGSATDASAKKGSATGDAAKTEPDAAAARKAREDAARQQQESARTRRTVTTGRARISFENAAVKDVLDYLASVGHFSIVYDEALAEAGIDLSTRTVSIRTTGMTYEGAINLILPRECGYRIGPGYVLITTMEKSYLPLQTRIYSIQLAMAEIPNFTDAPRFEVANVVQAAAQAAGGGGGGMGGFGGAAQAQPEDTGRATPERIIDMVKRFVKNSNDRRIAPWDDEGGPATIQYLGGRLVVSQTDQGHRAVLKLLAMIE
jgi:hypothetical protein